MELYTRNLAKARKTWTEHLNKQNKLSEKDILRLFDSPKTKEMTFDNFEVRGKIAIVLIGLSGCGKTGFAQNLMERFETLKLCSMDECGIEAIKKSGQIIREDDTIECDLFGQKIREFSQSNTPIVVDGLWLNLYTRSALYQTLKSYGYKICVADFITNYDYESHYSKLVSRAAETVAVRTIFHDKEDISLEEFYVWSKNAIKILSEERGCSEEEVFESMKKNPMFEVELNQMKQCATSEIIMQNVEFQRQTNLFKCGANFWITVY